MKFSVAARALAKDLHRPTSSPPAADTAHLKMLFPNLLQVPPVNIANQTQC
jgi:hypothetical protein